MRKIIVCLLILACFPTAAMAESEPPEITPQPGQVNPYRTRSELLMEAAEYTGVSKPEKSAELWAMGLQYRNAAMQYVVMTEELKREYAAQLDAQRSNWVTGMSSPWVQDFVFTEVRKVDECHTEINLRVDTATSYSPTQSYKAKLWLVHQSDFWRIERIWTDEELYPYTLYKPS